MTDPRERIEDKRLELGLTQAVVASALGVTQPHYSKIVGGTAGLTESMSEAMHAWLETAPTGPAVRRVGEAKRLARSIERQLRELRAMLEKDGTASAGRPVRRSARQR